MIIQKFRPSRCRCLVSLLMIFLVMILGQIVEFSAEGFAAEPIPPQPRRVLTPANVDRLGVIRQLEKDVYQLKRGPKRGELSLLSWESAIEVVSEDDFRPLRTIAGEHRLVNFAYGSNGELVAWSENGPGVTIHDLLRDEISQLKTEDVQPAMAFSTNGRWMATGGYAEPIKIWNPARAVIHSLDAGGEGGLTLVFSPDSTILAVGNRNHTTRLFDVASGKLLHTLPKAMSQELAFSPDGKVLAIGYVNGDVALWSVEAGKLLHSQPSGGKEIYTLDWSPQGDLLVTAGLNGKIKLWKPETLSELRELDGPEWIIRARFTSDGTRLLTAGGSRGPKQKDRQVVVWGLPDKE